MFQQQSAAREMGGSATVSLPPAPRAPILI